MALRLLFALLAALLLGAPAGADDGRRGVRSPGLARPGARDPGAAGRAPALRARRQLEDFVAERTFEAAVAVRMLSNDAERRAARERVERSGTPADVARWRDESLREERRDAVAAAVDLRALELRLGRPLGPATRRALLRSGLAVAQTPRRLEVEAEARELEREVERRLERPRPELLVPDPPAADPRP